MRRSSDGFSLSIGAVGRQAGGSIERAGGTWVPASRMWALCCLFVCSSACDSCNDDQGPSATPPTDGGPLGGSAGGAGQTGGGASGNTGGVSGGISGAGIGGGSGFSGIGGDPGFTMPTCFDCGNGCFDCGNGAGCNCMGEFVPAPWQPPFTAIGSAGWKDSTKPFCGGMQQSAALDLWADSTGVYALVVGQGLPLSEDVMDDDAGVASTTVNSPPSNMFGPGSFPGGPGEGFPGGMGPQDGGPRTRIWHNDGRGWALRAEGLGGSALSGLTGIQRGPLILFSNSFPEEFACRLGMTTRGGFNCYDVDPIQDVAVVNSSLAYALMGSVLGGTRLLVFDGTAWRNHPTLIPYPVLRLWADSTHVIAIGNAGTLMRLQGDKWELEDVGVLEGLTSIWGPSSDDLWLGTNSGKVLHNDGSGWKLAFQIAGKTCDARQPVMGLWGAGGTIYAHSPTALVRWKGGTLTTLGNWTCGLGTSQQVRSIWGRGENELFVGLMDAANEIQCGASYVAYFDGTEFHRM